MTPIANTMYSLGLFLALAVLLMWTKRKSRVSGTSRALHKKADA